MKVLLVTPEYPPDFGGGISVYCGDIARELRSLGCSVSVLRGSAFVHGKDSYKHEGVEVSVLESERFHKWCGRFSHFGMFPELRRHLAAAFAMHEQVSEDSQFDAVEVTDWGFLYLPWVIRSQAPVLVQLHGSNGQIAYHEPIKGREGERALLLFLDKIGLEAAPAISSQSRTNVRWWETLTGRAINYQPPPLTSPDKSNPIPGGNKWLTVGRIQHWKGPQVACAAWKQLGENAPELEWIGRDMSHGESECSSTSAWLGEQFPGIWKNKIHPIGSVSSDNWLRRMMAAKAILVPSLWDVLNRVVFEAMALGKVVVVSDGAGAVDLVEHGVNGFVFPKGDAAALADIVRYVENLSHDELRAMGNNAAATVLEKLDPSRIAGEKLKLYQDLPKPKTNDLAWFQEMLLPKTDSLPLAFLGGLPLRDLTAYVARRGLKKMLLRKNR
jgi:glycosyltransferase involved in cell wall biosynthesis